MSTSPVPVVSDEPQKIYFPSSTRSKLLHADYRMSQKAFDYDSCGKMARSYGCSGHGTEVEVVKRIPQTCKQRFSKCCAPRVLHQRMEKHEDIIELMMTVKPEDWGGEFWTWISAVSVRKTCALPDGKRDTEGALALAQSIRDTLKMLAREGKYIEDAQTENYFVKVALQGFEGTTAVIKAVYWGPHYAPGQIRSTLISRLRPDADIEVTTKPNRHADILFREMFHILVPDDEVEQAELEIAFHDKDLVFYSQRLDSEALNEYGSFPCVGLQGNEQDRNCDGCHFEVIPTCQKCGKQADMISEMHPLSATNEEISRGRWEKILFHEH